MIRNCIDSEDRRSEPRECQTGRVAWKKPGGRVDLPGWLIDSSRSGISFVASNRMRPTSGDEIEIFYDTPALRRYRTIRVADFCAQDICIIACQSIDSVGDTGDGGLIYDI